MVAEFYLELNSDDAYSRQFFPKNNASDFTFKLHQPLYLPSRGAVGGSWTVGLSDISIPAQWVNITSPDNTIKYLYRNSGEGWRSITMESGHYKLDDIFHVIREPFAHNPPNAISIKYDPKFDRVTIKSNPDNYTALSLSVKMARQLGFLPAHGPANMTEFVLLLNTKNIKALHRPLLEREKPDILFIYSDLVISTIVGDVHAPLLRAVHPHSDSQDYSLQTCFFKKPHYIPLLQPYFQTVKINIRQPDGHFASFDPETSSRVTLHFLNG